MGHPMSLPALGALTSAAAAFGVHLGESAVAEINPSHYRGPAVHPRNRGVAVEEGAFGPRAPRFADHYSWADGRVARAADCGDCEAVAARDVFADVAAYPALERRWASSSRRPIEVAKEPEPAPVDVPASEFIVETQELDRYASYPIDAEEAEYAQLQE